MPKRMSLKQKLHFGSKAQRSAARRAISAKRHTAPKRKVAKRQVHRARTQAAPRRRNIGEMVYLLGNPAKKGSKTMAKTKTRRIQHKQNAGTRRITKRNGMFAKRRRTIHRNPANVSNYLIAGASVVGGAVGSKTLTQLVLQTKNTGVMGYLGNAVATGLLGWGAHMFFKDKNISTMIVAGGVAQIFVRVLTDQTPFGSALSGAGLGDYVANWYTPVPQRVAAGYPPNALQLGAPAAASTPMVTHSPAGMGSALARADWN